jgi:hypothetical protein
VNDSTKTRPGRPTYTPDSDKPPTSGAVRATQVMGRALAKTGEHPKTEWLFWILGAAALIGDGAFVFKNPPKTTPEIILVLAWAGVAIAFIPGAVVKIRELISGAGGDAAKVWKSKDKDGAP